MIYRKCAEIVITVKKDMKKVYTFNCLFCGTICLQMKEFTLHVEQEHDEQLYEEERKQIDEKVSKMYMTDTNIRNYMEDVKIGLAKDEERQQECTMLHFSKMKIKSKVSMEDPLVDIDMSCQPASEDLESASSKNQRENSNKIIRTSDMDLFGNDDHKNVHGDQIENENTDNRNDEDTRNSLNTDEKCNFMESIVSSKINNKRIVIALIEFYKTHPIFWDNKHPDKNDVQLKENILQNFVKHLNDNFKSDFEMKSIKRQLNNLIRDYTHELEQELKWNNDEKYESVLWFYDQMEFLKHQIEKKVQHKRAKIRCKVKPLPDEMYGNILDIYKNYHALWDVNHLAFTIKEKRQETLAVMLNDVNNKLQLQMDVGRLERHLYYLHKIFAREKRNQLICEAKTITFQTSCPFYDKCLFLQNNQGPFRCTTCQLLIDSYNNYQLHKAKHDNGMAFKCPDCGLAFKKIGNYTLHAKRHLRVFKFICNICGKGYPVTSELDLHMRSHTGAHPYLCSVCGEGFRAAIAYDNHIRRHENRFKYNCHICQRGFNNLTRLNDHVKAHLNVRDILCGICGKGFTSRKYMNQHKRIHGGKNYACNICGKSFAQDSGLRAHKRNHGTPLSSINNHKSDKYSFLSVISTTTI